MTKSRTSGEYARAWRASNRDHLREYGRNKARKRRENPAVVEKDRALSRKIARRKRLAAFGIDDIVLLNAYAEQDGRCGICERPIQLDLDAKDRRGSGFAHADHDHATNSFRGLLCSECNGGLGKLGDDKAGLLRALAYLERVKP